MAQALGRVVDSSALDACTQPRAKHAIEVPAAWAGAEIVVVFPARLVCARCDGGGCDGCERRGGYRIDADEDTRCVSVTLPRSLQGVVVLRLVRPFGHDAVMTQVHLETRIGAAPSAGVELIAMPQSTTHAAQAQNKAADELRGLRNVGWVIAAVAAAGIATLLATMR